jgi:quinoprotein glucose dehydrogenase
MRRHGDAAIADLLADADPRIVLEAARAIHDVPIPAGTAALAARLDAPLIDGPDGDAFLRRSIAACEREGTPEAAARLARFVSRSDAPLDRRLEAVAVLRGWASPPSLDRVLGMWRPVSEPRALAVAKQAFERELPKILAAASDQNAANEKLRTSVLDVAVALGVPGVGTLLAAVCDDASRDPATRAAALAALAASGDAAALPLAVRQQARRLRAKKGTQLISAGVPGLETLAVELADVCAEPAEGEPRLREQQDAIDLLATLDVPAADKAIEGLGAALAAGRLDPRLALEVIEARDAKAGAIQPSAAVTEPVAELLEGGDAARGRELFFRRASLECVRCHRAEGTGGDVGPRLDGIAARRDRAYLLESVVRPSSQFAEGYRTTVVVTDEGRTLAGIVKGETPEEVVIMTADGRSHRIPASSIEDRSEGASAMPADLAAKLTRRELRDLVEWLGSLRKAD